VVFFAFFYRLGYCLTELYVWRQDLDAKHDGIGWIGVLSVHVVAGPRRRGQGNSLADVHRLFRDCDPIWPIAHDSGRNHELGHGTLVCWHCFWAQETVFALRFRHIAGSGYSEAVTNLVTGGMFWTISRGTGYCVRVGIQLCR
jgi:hypothetical protein